MSDDSTNQASVDERVAQQIEMKEKLTRCAQTPE